MIRIGEEQLLARCVGVPDVERLERAGRQHVRSRKLHRREPGRQAGGRPRERRHRDDLPGEHEDHRKSQRATRERRARRVGAAGAASRPEDGAMDWPACGS